MRLVRDEALRQAEIHVKGVKGSVGCGVQPVSVEHLRAAQESGGDALGMDPGQGPFACMTLLCLCYTFPLLLMFRHSDLVLRQLVLKRR